MTMKARVKTTEGDILIEVRERNDEPAAGPYVYVEFPISDLYLEPKELDRLLSALQRAVVALRRLRAPAPERP
jgi:hypothetical protein